MGVRARRKGVITTTEITMKKCVEKENKEQRKPSVPSKQKRERKEFQNQKNQ
jgi:hypothetical protein